MAKKNTAAVAEELAQPILEEMGLLLWDVVYEKEGSGWYLRYYVDREGGIDINSCEAFSRAVEKVLDAADPIEGSYTLEVSSPGIERQLTRIPDGTAAFRAAHPPGGGHPGFHRHPDRLPGRHHDPASG